MRWHTLAVMVPHLALQQLMMMLLLQSIAWRMDVWGGEAKEENAMSCRWQVHVQ